MSAISGRRHAAVLLLLLGWIALSADLVEAGQSGAYSAVDVGVLDGHDTSVAYAIDEGGRVAGTSISPDAPSYVTTGYTAVLWQDGAIVNLNDLIPADSGWWLSTAYGINDTGQIIGAGYYYGRLCGFVLTPTPA